MDGREAMALASGSTPYYFHRGGAIGGSGPQSGGYNPNHGFRALSNPNLPVQSNARPGSSGPAFAMEPSHANFGHGIDIAVPSGGSMSEPSVKKKRGRPRKYAPDGQVSLGLSPLPVRPKPSSLQDPMSPKRARGRPPGSGRKQQLALLGEWMNSSAGIAFSPHIIHIGAGEDVVAKILEFAQQRPRALCILSATGTISSVTLRQPASSEPSIAFEGRFEILCLSGSYLVAEEGGPRNRTGGVSASLASPDGHVVGGALGMLTAAGPVQVVACSFVYGASKVKDKPVGRPKTNRDGESTPQGSNDRSGTSKSGFPVTNTAAHQNFMPSTMNVWSVSPRPVDLRNPHTDIDLTRG
ncbi:AT-hook motif nuclear-localized protein 5 [Euphorbia lathyris]|uniref:AT-hook motif nuclear-localized protein 5 n=1 Tax=Euphorbia lathyris TaxID=212925 RepID=UPI0033137BB8